MTRTIRHVDAFTSVPLEGNPAAVVDGEGLDGETMQRIALNQKLSETVFLLPPESPANHARLRIFTPGVELPFAGHPVVAAAHALASESLARLGDGEALRLETGAGVIPVEVGVGVNGDGASPLYTMTQARPKFRAAALDAATIANCVGLAAGDVVRVESVSTGIYWTLAQISSLDAMLRVQPDLHLLMQHRLELAVFCIGAQAAGVDLHVRAFAPADGVFEDPVTGSANGCIGSLIARHGLMKPRDGAIRYVAEQGLEMGQPGRVHVSVSAPGGSAIASPASDDAIEARVGGHAVTVLRGELLLGD